MREAIEAQAKARDVLQGKLDARETALRSIEVEIERLLMLVAAGGDRLDYVAEKLRRLESDARVQKAELQVLRSTQKKPPDKSPLGM